MRLAVLTSGPLRGSLRAPSDKSLTHRAYLFGGIARGVSQVQTPLTGEDCESTLACLRALGVGVEKQAGGSVRIEPPPEWKQPARDLDCGNSGTTMRLLSGLLASRPLDARLIGDASLSRRPMKRIAEPLRLMGASVEGETPPLRILGRSLEGIAYQSPVASAQIKSCVLLAGLRASGETWVAEPAPSRDHTERMLQACGVRVLAKLGRDLQDWRPEFAAQGASAGLAGGQELSGFNFSVPGDISSAAFFLVAGRIVPGSRVTLREVGCNPTRTGILDVLAQTGHAATLRAVREELGEPVGDLDVSHVEGGHPFHIEGALVPRLIDEIPALAVLATQLDGISTIRDAKELRVKESDRIAKVAEGLRAMGARVETREDGLDIEGPTPLKATCIAADGDHRIAMAFAVAGLIAEGETLIDGADSIATSYPEFEAHLRELQR